MTDDDPADDWTEPGVFRSAPDVYRIPLPLPQDGLRAVNVYAVADADGWTLIDSGWALDEARDLLEAALKALGSGFGDVRRFLVTHAHRDHYTLASVLRREYGTQVLLGRGEEPNLDVMHDAARKPGDADAPRLVRSGAHELARQVRDTPWPVPDIAQWEYPDEWIADRAVLEVGAGPAQGVGGGRGVGAPLPPAPRGRPGGGGPPAGGDRDPWPHPRAPRVRRRRVGPDVRR